MDLTRSRPAPLPDVLRIAVVRGGGLGDLVFTLPALDALSAAYPEAEIVLLGTRAHAELLRGRRGPVSRVEVVPAGVLDGRPGDEMDRARFITRMRAERFDLVCQLHGGGRYSNPFSRALRARHSVGAATDDAAPLDATLPYVYYEHETMRWMEVAALAGASAVSIEPRLSVRAVERQGARRHLDPSASGVLVLHPGATDPRRRWPAERFGEVARRSAEDGFQVIVVGDDTDRQAAETILAIEQRALDLTARLGLRDLLGLLAEADVVVGNDSGPRHLAQALGTRTVGVFWVGNVINGAPLTRHDHRVHFSWVTRCPRCGRDSTQVGWTAPRCEHDDSFVAEVPVDDVYADVLALMATRALSRA